MRLIVSDHPPTTQKETQKKNLRMLKHYHAHPPPMPPQDILPPPLGGRPLNSLATSLNPSCTCLLNQFKQFLLLFIQ
jgi:hypothetical protein